MMIVIGKNVFVLNAQLVSMSYNLRCEQEQGPQDQVITLFILVLFIYDIVKCTYTKSKPASLASCLLVNLFACW